MKSFSVIIVTWNGLHHLKEFLPSVVHTNYADFEIIIADNASTDGSQEWLKETYPDVTIAQFDNNYGYCGGNNRALPFATKEILVFLNNDVRVTPDWLTHLALSFDDENVAAAQPKILSHREPKKLEYAGAAGGFIDKYGYPFCRGRVFDHVETDNGQYDDKIEIFWATGAALAIRKDLFLFSGGFDEDFEFHMEEIDLCWRMLNEGYVIRYAPESIVYHLGGGSLPMGSPRKVYYNFRNSLIMLWKNYTFKALIFRFPIRFVLDVVAAYKALLTGKPKEFFAIARAHLYFFFKFFSIYSKRRSLKKHKTLRSSPSTMMPINLVVSHFIKGKKVFGDLSK